MRVDIRNKLVIKDHIVMVKEPDTLFLGYSTIHEETGHAILNGIMNYLDQEEYSLEHLVAVGCDGTVVNTGWQNGVIALWEKRLHRPLQLLVCLLHFNELPLRALFKAIGQGKQTGPTTWSGPIGSIGYPYLQVKNFTPIAFGNMPSNINSYVINLSTDQKRLYQWAKAISTGVVGQHLKDDAIGPLNAARWNTFGTRILRLYASYEKPTIHLENLAIFVMKVYIPFWFHVKNNPLAIDGSRNLFKYIQLVRELPQSVQVHVYDAIQRNGFYAHPENILLGMITDNDKNIRQDGYAKILTCRERQSTRVRLFTVPLIQFQCSSYMTMINWTTTRVTEPPITQYIPNEILNDLADSDEIIDIGSNSDFAP